MGVYNYLIDCGEIDYSSYYNGPLSDYLKNHEDDYKDVFSKLLEINPEVYLYKGFDLKLNMELLSNKKIGYRDAGKIPENVARIPYIIYWKNEQAEKAIVLDNNSYIEARGMYYICSEPGNTFEQYRGNMVATYLSENNKEDLVSLFTAMQKKENTAGMMQRRLDSRFINDIELMKDDAAEMSKKMFEDALAILKTTDDRKVRSDLIYKIVIRAFLLKKSVYVKYMTSKFLLEDRHAGNVVEQRKFAKAYCDEVEIVPYFTLWNTKPDSIEQK